MNAWGLAQRLDIAPDEAQEIIDGYFAGFPKIKAYLAAQVERARLDGYTETLLGRRRYIPELTSDNRRLRELGSGRRSTPRSRGAPPTCSRWR